MSTPMRPIRSNCCCARALADHAAAVPPSSVMNSRRFTAQYLPCSRQRIAQHCCAASQSGLCLLGVTSDGLVPFATGPLYSPTADVGADI